MSNDRSKGIVGIFILITVLFLIFIIFAFYTVSNLKHTARMGEDEFISPNTAPIAVVEVEGVIMESTNTIKKLLMAERDKSVKAIIVRVNSPGGAVGPTQEIYEEIRRIDEKKPVYASFGTVAASGGYYIGAAARKIYSPAGTMTGSIGVIMNFMNLSELYKWAKVNPELIKSGKYKDIGSSARPMTDEERMLLSQMTENVHEQFIMDIFKVRQKRIVGGIEGLRKYAQGQIYSGKGAQELGLVDEIAGLWQAGRNIHQELKIKEKFNLKFVKLKKDFSLSDFLTGMEQTVQDFKYGVRNNIAPLLMLSL